MGGGGSDIAATTTAAAGSCSRPARAAMSDASLRIVLRHELFHFAVTPGDRRRRATLAHRGRRRFRRPPAVTATPGRRRAGRRNCPPTPTWTPRATRSPALRPGVVVQPVRRRSVRHRRRCAALYLRGLRPGHPDAATAVRDVLGADLTEVLRRLAALAGRLA